MFPGPVFNVELLKLSRRARYYVVRTLYGMLLLLLVWQQYDRFGNGGPDDRNEVSIQAMSTLGSALFWTFAWTQSWVLLLLTPALVAGVIAEERQRKTLHYLLASCLTSGEIVLGKLFARLLHIATFVAVGMPIVALFTLFGGVDPNVMLLFFAATATSVFVVAAFSILVSTYARRPRDAVVSAYLLEVVWLIGPSLALWTSRTLSQNWNGPKSPIDTVIDWVGWCTPVHVLSDASRLVFVNGGRFLESILLMMGLQMGLGVSMVALAVFRLRPVFRKEEGPRRGPVAFLTRPLARFRFRPSCGNDAMLWKEVFASNAGLWTRILGTLVLWSLLLPVGYLAADTVLEAVRELVARGYGAASGYHAQMALNGMLRFLMTVLAGLLLIRVSSTAACGVTSEREGDTWVSLVSTPLSGAEIVRAKIVGSLWSARALILVWLGLMFLGLILGAIHPLGALATTIATSVYVCFGAALGMFFSLRARTSARAVTATVIALIILNGGYLLLLIPTLNDARTNTLIFVGVTPFVEACALMSYDDVQSFEWWDASSGMHVAMACIISVLVHAALAAGLVVLTLGRFEVAVDRPRRDRTIPGPGPLVSPKKATAEPTGLEG